VLAVAALDAISYRPGVTLELVGCELHITERQRCIRRGTEVEMTWCDGEWGDWLFAKIADPQVADTDIAAVTCEAALRALVAADIHELCEHFRVDGNLVYDPHPNGGRFEVRTGVDVHVRIDDQPGPHEPGGGYPYRHDTDRCEIDVDTARRIAARLCDRVTVGDDRYTVHGNHLTHIGHYPDRDTGETREWLWSREWFDSYSVAEDGNPGAQLRSAICADMFALAVESTVHEAAEWFHFEGQRLWDPHPRPHTQRDRISARIVLHAEPLVSAVAPPS
jgi:hypothetical protein